MELNYLAILAATAASFVLGGLWYSPVLFGKVREASGPIKAARLKATISVASFWPVLAG